MGRSVVVGVIAGGGGSDGDGFDGVGRSIPAIPACVARYARCRTIAELRSMVADGVSEAAQSEARELLPVLAEAMRPPPFTTVRSWVDLVAASVVGRLSPEERTGKAVAIYAACEGLGSACWTLASLGRFIRGRASTDGDPIGGTFFPSSREVFVALSAIQNELAGAYTAARLMAEAPTRLPTPAPVDQAAAEAARLDMADKLAGLARSVAQGMSTAPARGPARPSYLQGDALAAMRRQGRVRVPE